MEKIAGMEHLQDIVIMILPGRIDGSIWCTEGDEENGEYFHKHLIIQQEQKMNFVNYMKSNGVDTNKLVAFFCGDSWGAATIAYWCQSVDL